jgi:MFS family permease
MTTASGQTLWRHADFLKLWAGQTISMIGSQVTFLALPLVAVLTLDAAPFQMGLLTAIEAVPALLIGLHAGALVDRHRRRPILIGSDLGRAALLALIPLAWAFDVLTMPLVYLVALLTAALSFFFGVAYGAYLPSIVPRERLVEGNAKLALSGTAAEVAGPGLAGGLVHLLSAPVALLLDALSYLGSAALIAWVKIKEPAPLGRAVGARLSTEIREGLAVVFGDPRLRALVAGRSIIGGFNAMLEAIFVLFVARTLGVGPALLGAIFAVGSVGFLVGALLPERVGRRIGVGPATVAGVALLGLSDLLVPLAGGSLWLTVPLLTAAQFFFGVGLTLFHVHPTSTRQAIVPGHILGRHGATGRVMADALIPLGALLGGLLGEVLGLRATLVLAAGGELLAALWLWSSPLRGLRELPAETMVSS